MSSPSEQENDPDDFSQYAPRWVRESKRVERRPQWDDGAQPANAKAPPSEAAPADDGLVIDRLRIPRSLEPGFVPEPPRKGRASSGHLVARWALACAAAGGIAYVATVRFPDLWTSEDGGQATETALPTSQPFSTRFDGRPGKSADRGGAESGRLIAVPPAAHGLGEAAALGLSIRGGGEGQAVILGGLPPGATLSAGFPYGAGGWRIAVSELAEAQIFPPRGFAGAMEIGVELRSANDVVADRRSLRLEWSPPKPAEKPAEKSIDRIAAITPPAETQSTAPTVQLRVAEAPRAAQPPREATLAIERRPADPPRPAPKPEQDASSPRNANPVSRNVRLIERTELETLIRRGEEFLANGDVSAARAALKRAAEAQDARAAFMLASTYDPNVLEKMNVMGFQPDIAMARVWYEKAREFGSPDAPRRLEMLASRAQ